MKQGITVSAGTVLALASLITAFGAIFGVIFSVYRWYLRQNRQDIDIERIKEENSLIVYALSACLDGLAQLGAADTVRDARERLDQYINKQAHR